MHELTLHITKIELKNQFNKAINDYWYAKIKNITLHDHKNLFPEIERIFRSQNQTQTHYPNFIISPNKTEIIKNVKIDQIKIPNDEQGNFIITNYKDKLNILGAHFASVNKLNRDMGRQSLNNIVTHTVDNFKNEMMQDIANNKSLINFNDNNLAKNTTITKDPQE